VISNSVTSRTSVTSLKVGPVVEALETTTIKNPQPEIINNFENGPRKQTNSAFKKAKATNYTNFTKSDFKQSLD